MFNDIKSVLDACETCNKIHSRIDYRHLRPIEAKYPFQLVSLDTGHIPYSDKDHYFIVAVDHFTRWVEVKSIKKENSEEIIQFIKEFIIYCQECPAKIQSDGGRPYVSSAILRFCEMFNIQHSITASYHPQSNGKAERMIQTLKKNVKKLQLDNFTSFSRALQVSASAY